MKIFGDLHTHTIASGHALSSLQEMVDSARQLGYGALAITDHGCAMPGAPHIWYFEKLLQMPTEIDGLLLLRGVEANVMDLEGSLDMPREMLARFDWVIASMHSPLLEPLPSAQTTEIWLKVAENADVDMIGHCEQRIFPFEHDRVTKAFAQNDKVVEINAGSAVSRPGNEDILLDIARHCKKNQTKVAITSDAHSAYEMDRLQQVIAMLESIDFPEALVINSSEERLLAHLNKT